MKKLLLLPIVGLVAAGCSTTEYYQDDLAVAQRLDEDQQRQAQRVERTAQPAERQTVSREQFEQQREVKEMQAKLDEVDRRISTLEREMESMPADEREQTAREVSDLRQRQQRAEQMLSEAEGEDPGAFVEVRDELRDAVNELEVGIYRVLVRDTAEPAPGETIQ